MRNINLRYVDEEYDDNGVITKYKLKYPENYNFGYDVVDDIASNEPDRLAMVWCNPKGVEKRFTFGDISRLSNKTANYFKSIGIKKGDAVLVILKRHYQFWYAMLGLNKLGAVAIPASNQLLSHDIEYRINAAGISAVICTSDGESAEEVDKAGANCPTLIHKIIVGEDREGWRSFDKEYQRYSSSFPRTQDSPKGEDLLLMFFTSGTSGYPKIAAHNHKYPLGHFHTARYWHMTDVVGLHFTISDTGWAKAMWGKLYGQWLNESATFVYDFDRFHAQDIMPLFAKYQITSSCAPPTMLRMMIKEDLSK